MSESTGNDDRLRFECPDCGKPFEAPRSRAGMRLKCSGCGELVTIPVPEPVESKAEEVPSKEGGTRRLSVGRVLTWCGIAALFLVAANEWRSRSGYQWALDELQQSVDEDEELSLAELDASASFWPTRSEGHRWVVYRWPSLVHDYSIKIDTDGDLVLGYDTVFDESDLPPKPPAAPQPVPEPRLASTDVDRPGRVAPADPFALAAKLKMIGETRHRANATWFTARMREVSPHLAPVEVGTVEGRSAPWNRVTLNEWGSKFDGIRFRSPLDVPADMYWCFGGRRISRWYMLPLEEDKSFQAFRTYDTIENRQYAEVRTGYVNQMVVQPLVGGRIQPGREYVIWFEIEGDEPFETHVAIQLEPAGRRPVASGTSEWMSRVGLELLQPPFDPSPAGVRDGLRYDGALRRRVGRFNPDFETTLQAISQGLTEVAVADGVPTDWQTLRSDEENFGFSAFRIPPGDADAGLDLALVGRSPFAWGVSTPDGALDVEHAFPMVGLELGGLETTGRELTTLLHVPGDAAGSLVLWTASNDASSHAVSVRARRSPADDGRLVDAGGIAERLGLDVPASPSPERVAATLEWLPRLQQVAPDLVWPLLEPIATTLPEVPPSDGREPANWARLSVPAGATVAAVRFTSTLDDFGELYTVLQKPGVGRVSLTSSDGDSYELDVAAFSDSNWGFDGVDKPEGHHVWAHWGGAGTVAPETTYVLWMAADAAAEEQRVDVAVRMAAENEAHPGLAFRPIVAALNLHATVTPPVDGCEILGEHAWGATAVRFTPDGRHVLTGGLFGEVRAWDPAQPDAARLVARHDSAITGLWTVGDDRFAIRGREATTVVVRKLEDGAIVDTYEFEGPATEVAFSRDGKRMAVFASVGAGGVLAVHDLENGERTTQPLGTVVRGMAISPDGATLVTSESGRSVIPATVFFRDAATLNPMASFTEPIAWFDDVAFSLDGSRVSAISEFGLLKVWDVATREVVAALSGDYLQHDVAISPDGTLATSALETRGPGTRAGTDLTGSLWDVDERRVVRKLLGHRGGINDVAFSPDGSRFATVGVDGTVRLWDATFRPTPEPGLPARNVTNSIDMVLVPIPSGDFEMGAPAGDGDAEDAERPRHPVTISRPFLLGRTEVTVSQFRQFVDATEYETTVEKNGEGGAFFDFAKGKFVNEPDRNWRNPGYEQTDRHPVVNVAWEDANAFCTWLSEKEGATYRLPSEAEWEYACRAGSDSLWSHANDQRSLQFIANVSDLSAREEFGPRLRLLTWANWKDGHAFPAPVASYAANPWGLHDMHGNVWDLCSDIYDEAYYAATPRVDPRGPDGGAALRVARGGTFLYPPSYSRASYRGYTLAINTTGFRVLCEVAAPTAEAEDRTDDARDSDEGP